MIVDSSGTDFSVKKVVLTLPLAIAITLIVVLTWHIWALLSLSILGLLLLLARLPLLQRVPKMRLHHRKLLLTTWLDLILLLLELVHESWLL